MGPKLRMAHPEVPVEVLERLRGILVSGQFVQGAEVRQFERGVSRWVGGREVVAVSSGTMASYLAFLHWKQAGYGRLVLPAFSFPSVASAALLAGFELELADIDGERLAMHPNMLGEWSKGALVLTVDSFGIPGFLPEWTAWQRASGGVWLEDAACGLGAEDAECVCGSAAPMAFLSFHPRKVLTTGEGGAVVCDSAEAESIRTLRNLGMLVSGGERRFQVLGVNGRMSEFHAAVGNAHLATLPRILERRREIGARYVATLPGVAGVEMPAGYRLAGVNFQSMVVRLSRGGSRERVLRRLNEEGIEATVAGFYLPNEAAFSGVKVRGDVSESRRLGESGIALPIHEGMCEGDVDRVCGVLGRVLAEASGLS